MWAGKGRRYKVSEIQGRHFVETGLASGFSREQVVRVFEDIKARAEQAFEAAVADMPPGFPAARCDSGRRGFEQRGLRLSMA